MAVPWCEPCERFWNPASVSADGACPTCGAAVEARPDSDAAAAHKVPWHFWVAIAAAAIYLGWRAIQGIVLLF